jgi:hypothetical protein
MWIPLVHFNAITVDYSQIQETRKIRNRKRKSLNFLYGDVCQQNSGTRTKISPNPYLKNICSRDLSHVL